jgi:threonine/homoserine/homoserine lactone efflux protein
MTSGEWLHLYINLTLIGLVEAMSPIRVAVILLLLSGDRPVIRSSVFVAGVAIFSLLFGLLVDQSGTLFPALRDRKSPLSVAIGLALGIGLLLLAIRTWHRQPPQQSDAGELKMPAMVTRFSDKFLYGSLAAVFVGGVLMQLFSLKSLLLYSAGLKQIVQANVSPLASLIAMLFLIVVMLSEMIVPTVLFATSPANSARLLNQMSQWLQKYSYTALAAVEAALAIYLLAENIIDIVS